MPLDAYALRNRFIYALNQRVAIFAVNGAGLFDCLASCRGSAQTVHSYLKKELRGLGIFVENIAYYGILCYHFRYILSNIL